MKTTDQGLTLATLVLDYEPVSPEKLAVLEQASTEDILRRIWQIDDNPRKVPLGPATSCMLQAYLNLRLGRGALS